MALSRRAVLKATGLAALAAGSGSIAGCTESIGVDDEGGDEDESGYEGWLFDPAAHADVKNEFFASLDVRSAYENREHLPDEFSEAIEDADEELDSIELTELRRTSGIGFFDRDGAAGMSIVTEGTFDAEALAEEIQEEDGEVESLGSHEEYELYGVEEETFSGDPRSVAFAISEDVVVTAYTERTEFGAEPAATASIDAKSGDETRYYDENENAETIADELADATMTVGVDFDQELAADEFGNQDVVWNVVNQMDAVGFGTTIEGDVTANTVLLVYDDEEAASAEDVEAFLDTMEEEGVELLEYVDDVSVSEDGRAVAITAEVETTELWENLNLFEAQESGEQPARTPQVSMSFDQDTEGYVTIMHNAGDTIEGDLLVSYTADGELREEIWSEPDGISAGDAYTTEQPADGGSYLLVVDQESYAAIGEYQVP